MQGYEYHDVRNLTSEIPYSLESNPHPFYSFRGLKGQMRIRIECGLDSRSTAGVWPNDRAGVRTVRTIQGGKNGVRIRFENIHSALLRGTHRINAVTYLMDTTAHYGPWLSREKEQVNVGVKGQQKRSLVPIG
jgi:hypothetical protein